MQYFDTRRQLLRQIEHYGVNRQINLEEVERIVSNADTIIDRYPLLREQLTEMRLLSATGDERQNDFLWQTMKDYPSSHRLVQLARLILSFNLTSGFPLEGHQEEIRRQIKQLLHIEVDLPQSYTFGCEGQRLEFKTSTVFPPDNDMRPNLEEQTYNLMKVVCGMLNAQGGTLLLGVNDAGVACGLQEDLLYFKGDLDRLKRHVRDSIFRKFGLAINDRVRDEQLPAGKHVVLAFHIPASNEPVALDNSYFVRQGSSSRYITSAEMVRKLMAARDEKGTAADWSASGLETKTNTAPLPADEHAVGTAATTDDASAFGVGSAATASTEGHTSLSPASSSASAAQNTDETTQQLDGLALLKQTRTSLIRSNVVNNWDENYGIDTVAYLRFYDQGEWCVMDEENWDEGWLTLAVHDREEKGSLLMVYEDGVVNRVPMELCLDKTRNKHFKRYNERTPLFFCPVAPGDALLMAYRDDHGNRFFRLDNVDRIPEGKMLSAGNKLVRPDFEQVVFCEVIPAGQFGGLEKFYNLKDTTLGHSLDVHYEKERNILSNLGIKF